MKHLRIIPLLLLLLQPLVVGAQPDEHSKRREARKRSDAELVLLSVEHDFGTVDRRGGDLTFSLRYRNDGTGPLVLTRVITSCSCLKSDFSKRPIPPGGEGTICLTYQPLKAESGTFHKVVQILSNAASGRVLFTIRGNSIDPKRDEEQQPHTFE